MRRLLTAILAVTAAAALTSGPASGAGERSTSADARASASRTVAVRDDRFAPSSVSVRKRGTVRFVWRGSNTHNVRAYRGRMTTCGYRRSGSCTRRFRRRGLVKLICDAHPTDMRATVRVR